MLVKFRNSSSYESVISNDVHTTSTRIVSSSYNNYHKNLVHYQPPQPKGLLLLLPTLDRYAPALSVILILILIIAHIVRKITSITTYLAQRSYTPTSAFTAMIACIKIAVVGSVLACAEQGMSCRAIVVTVVRSEWI